MPAEPPTPEAEPPSLTVRDLTSKHRLVWDRELGDNLHGMACDVTRSQWWVRSQRTVYKLDKSGVDVTRLYGGDTIQGCGGLCIDSTRNHLVAVSNKELVCMSLKDGGVVRRMKITNSNGLSGITYCHHSDIFVITDDWEHRIWYVAAETGAIIDRIGTKGSGDMNFDTPFDVCHVSVSNPDLSSTINKCEVVVADFHNHCLKFYSIHGQYVGRFGSRGHGVGQFMGPNHLCVDRKNRIVVSDTYNNRVVRYNREDSKWDVLLSHKTFEDNLRQVAMTPDGKQLLVSLKGDKGKVIKFKHK